MFGGEPAANLGLGVQGVRIRRFEVSVALKTVTGFTWLVRYKLSSVCVLCSASLVNGGIRDAANEIAKLREIPIPQPDNPKLSYQDMTEELPSRSPKSWSRGLMVRGAGACACVSQL